MRLQSKLEIAELEGRRQLAAAHAYRLANWQPNAFWIDAWPNGIICPFCGADHCEVDGHSCGEVKCG